jgi:hypothetical protein
MATATKVVGNSEKPPRAGMGRPKGSPNKTTSILKDALIQAASEAHEDGMTGYLKQQAKDNPVAFMGLLGKVLPLQIAGDPNNPLRNITTIELVAGGISSD